MEKFYWILALSIFLADLLIRLGLSLRVIMRKKEASVPLAWLVIILLLPFLGAVIHLLLGENRLGQKRAVHAADNVSLFKKWVSGLEHRIQVEWNHVSPECRPVEDQTNRVIGLPTLPGNKLELIDNPIARARYDELTRSGVKILKFGAGLLHSKTITINNDFSLIGSVNLDMRSFWLNFKLTLFVYNREFTEKLRKVQLRCIEQARSFGERFMENTALLVGPLL